MQPKGILELTGKKLKCSAMPIGGIGTGSIAIGGDGLLKQWQITNTVKHNAFVPNSFFGIWIKKVGESNNQSICRALICPKVHEDPDFKPAESVSDHKIGLGAKEMFEILPGVENIIFNGEYPIAFLKFIDRSLPLDISLSTFNPFIPLDSNNSGLPLIIFQFQIVNTSNSTIEFTLAGNFLNFLGWNGLTVFKGTESILFAGNKNNHEEIGDWQAIHMTSKTVLKSDRRYGDLTFAIDDPNGMVVNQWSNLKDFWEYFSREGTFPKKYSEEISPVGHTWTGSIGSRQKLNSGESINVNFILSWNFPNRIVDWNNELNKDQIQDEKTEFWIGNHYNKMFKNSIGVFKYFQNNSSYLIDKTAKFHDIIYSSTILPEILTSITAPLSTIRSPSCFWMKDGSFHGFEGCNGASTQTRSGGCCPLNCTHVWNYEFSIAHLYPSLERSMRETEFKIQHESGYIPHRTVVPLYLPQILKYGMFDLTGPALDGMFGTILKIYRDYLITGDTKFLTRSWPIINKLINYIFENYDVEHKGVIFTEQPNTYDCSLYGINSFIGSLYLASLLACEKIARLLNLSELPEKFKNIYESGRKILDQECWNGEYYIQIYDDKEINEHQYGIGCHSDQLIGQWWAFQLGFGYILPTDHVNKAIESIVKYNFKEHLQGIKQFRIFASETDPGLLVCTWPHGKEPSIPTLYSNEVWTGLEYEVAALCFYTGNISNALKIINAVRRRYDGTRRNPWNEVECGDHYVRAMSSWTLLHALTGISYSTILKQFELSPKINPENFKSFFVTGRSWGEVSQQITANGVVFTISVAHGELEINSFKFTPKFGFKPIKSKVVLKHSIEESDNQIESNYSIEDDKIIVYLKKMIVLKENYQLSIKIN